MRSARIHFTLKRWRGLLTAAGLLHMMSGCASGPTPQERSLAIEVRESVRQERETLRARAADAGAAASLSAAEKRGDKAADAGHPAAALAAYQQALKEVVSAGEDAARLREKILKAAATMDAPPAVPEEARKHMVWGKSLVKDAQGEEDYARAAAELEGAIRAAPWWTTAYYDLGLIYEKAGDYKPAALSLRMYLVGAPEAADSRKVQDKIYELELHAKNGDGRRFRAKTTVEWVAIPGGVFVMGAFPNLDVGPYYRKDAWPPHRVDVPTFQLAKTLVTVAQYKACVDAGACKPPETGNGCVWGIAGRDDYPLNCVEWEQAKTYSEWVGGRLPSESEWEYAARDGGEEDRPYPWPETRLTFEEFRERVVMHPDALQPPCSKPKGNTSQGLCDMVGDLWEWVEDAYHFSYDGAPTDGSAWDSMPLNLRFLRVNRGGSWENGSGEGLRTNSRNFDDQRNGYARVGFRPARTLR